MLLISNFATIIKYLKVALFEIFRQL